MKAYKPIRSTKGQRDKLRKLNKGVGFLVYHFGNCETMWVDMYTLKDSDGKKCGSFEVI